MAYAVVLDECIDYQSLLNNRLRKDGKSLVEVSGLVWHAEARDH